MRFPDGKVFEDIATAYRLFENADSVCCIPDVLYHYSINPDGISKVHGLRNLIDYWDANHERYLYLSRREPYCLDRENVEHLIRSCTAAAFRTWRWIYPYLDMLGEQEEAKLREMEALIREKSAECDKRDWPIYLKIAPFCMRFRNKVLFAILYYMNMGYRGVGNRFRRCGDGRRG